MQSLYKLHDDNIISKIILNRDILRRVWIEFVIRAIRYVRRIYIEKRKLMLVKTPNERTEKLNQRKHLSLNKGHFMHDLTKFL